MTRHMGYYDKQPEFLGTTVVEIDVPSGRLIAADSLCSIEHFDVDPPLSINYGFGLDVWAKKFAELNLAYAFVGNTSPSVTRDAAGLIQVVSPDWNEKTHEPKLDAGERVVASICTDLWAAMLTDYQGWLDHGGPDVAAANAPYALEKYNVIDVAPGKYRWTVYSHSDRFDRDRDGRVTYAQLELIEAF